MVDLVDVSFIWLLTGMEGKKQTVQCPSNWCHFVGKYQAAELTDVAVTTYVLSAGPISAVGNVTFL